MNVIVKPKVKAAISAEEMERRRKALRRAYAHNRLEGMFPTAASDEVFQSFVRGEIELNEIRPRLEALRHRL